MLNFKKFLAVLVMIGPFCKEDVAAKNLTPLDIRRSNIGMRQKFPTLAMTRKGTIFARNVLQPRVMPETRRFLAMRGHGSLAKKGLVSSNKAVLPETRRCLAVRGHGPLMKTLAKKGLISSNKAVFDRRSFSSRLTPQRRFGSVVPGRKLFGGALVKGRSPVVPMPSTTSQLPPVPPTHYTIKFKDFPVGYRTHVARECARRGSPPPLPESSERIPHNSVKGKLEQCKTLEANHPGISQAILSVLKAQGYKE